MNQVIARDADVLREFLGILDEKRRKASLFGRLAAAIKLAALKRELDSISSDGVDDEVQLIRKQIYDRMNGSLWQRICSRRLGARLLIFLLVLLCNQLALLLVLAFAAIFSGLARAGQSADTRPLDELFFTYLVLFLFFAVTPLAAIAAVMGGRFFGGWRVTGPALILIMAFSALGTYLAVRGKVNPTRTKSSLEQFAIQRGLGLQGYQGWEDMNWLMKDAAFKQDYERYFRNGPGRWITARFDPANDGAWRDSMQVMNDYLDAGQDREAFREWLKYYLERNRIFSEDRVDQEVSAMTAEVNQRALGVWQMQPLLRERDSRVYSDYLNSIAAASRKWGIVWLAVLTLCFLIAYLARPLFSSFGNKGRANGPALSTTQSGARTSSQAFPESARLTQPYFFDAPHKILSNVHRAFLRVSISAGILVFLFWILTYLLWLAAAPHHYSSQLAFIRGYIMFLGSDNTGVRAGTNDAAHSAGAAGDQQTKEQLQGVVAELRSQVEDVDYDTSKKLKQQAQLIARQRAELGSLTGTTSQLQQTASALPGQMTDLNARANAADSRAGQAIGDASAAKQQADAVEKKVTSKMSDVETRAARASDQAGRATERAAIITTRTDALEKEVDRRAREVEARTEELGERTTKLDEEAKNLRRLQIIAFTALVAKLKADTEDLDHRTQSLLYRLFSKSDARRDAASLSERITKLAGELRQMEDPDATQLIEQLEELGKRVEDITARVK
ncbi:MAG: hypothetical protein DMF61_18810 [Blastocatellia bacterium AA13]|nr:MAG: hypothetical protein DMF61_18810 [Blastocatellia bacterium AA13]